MVERGVVVVSWLERRVLSNSEVERILESISSADSAVASGLALSLVTLDSHTLPFVH